MRLWKRIVCVSLASMLVFSVAGCGKKEGESGEGKGDIGQGISQEEKAKQAMEGVFSSQEIALDYSFIGAVEGEHHSTNVFSILSEDNQLRILMTDNRENQTVPYMITCDLDGKNQKNIMLEGTEPVTTEETTESKVVAEDTPSDFVEEEYHYEYTGYQNFSYSEEGILYGLKCHTESDNESSVEEYNLMVWDSEGKLLAESPITGLGYNEKEGTNRYINAVLSGKDGTVTFVTGGDKWESFTAQKDGTVSAFSPLKLDQKYTTSLERMVPLKDGKVGISYYNEDWTKMNVAIYNPETGAVEKEGEVPAAVRNMGFYNVYPGVDSDFIFGTSNGIYSLSVGDTEAKKILDFINSDLEITELQTILQKDADTLIASDYDYMNDKVRVALYKKVPAEQIVEKQIMTLGGLNLQYQSQLRTRIIDFNKNNASYRITIKDYSEYNTDDDYTAGVNRLNSDIAAGKCPDIIYLNEQIPVESYTKKGLFANIDELIAADNELSKNEYMENVFDAYRVDGKLYRVIPTFYIQTYLAKKSLVGDVDSITMEKAKEIVKGLGNDASVFDAMMTREGFISAFMQFCGGDFVNTQTGACSFDSQEFIELLKAAKDYTPEAEMSNDYDDDFWEEYNMQYRNNKTLLYNAYFSSMSDLKYTIQGQIGEDVAYVGFPSAQNGGATVTANENCFAINAKTGNVDAAWQFVRYYLTEEYQTSENRWGCPVLKSAVKEDLKKNMEANTWTDEETGEVINYDTFWSNGVEIPYEPMNQAQIDNAYAYFCNVKTRPYDNQAVLDIINEEAAAFFSGQKPVEDVVGIIQSRVKLLINE